jgi:ABC-type microcin C transport system duplicated ATPase subunit YejF
VTCHAILGLLARNGRKTAGSILFKGDDLGLMRESQLERLRGDDIGMVFQDPVGSLNPVHTVGSQLRETLRLHRGLSDAQSRTRALDLMRLMGIPEPELRLKAYPHQLSGGLAQRVMIAMALACEPDLLIADEPTTALDVTIQAQILDLLNRLKREFAMAMLFVTHDLGVVAEMADDILVMRHGQVVESGEAQTVLSRPQAPYTRQLLEAAARLDDPAPVYRERAAVWPSRCCMSRGCVVIMWSSAASFVRRESSARWTGSTSTFGLARRSDSWARAAAASPRRAASSRASTSPPAGRSVLRVSISAPFRLANGARGGESCR